MTFQEVNYPIMSKLIRGHVGGELNDNSDEDIEVVVDVVVFRKDDTSAIIPTEHMERTTGMAVQPG